MVHRPAANDHPRISAGLFKRSVCGQKKSCHFRVVWQEISWPSGEVFSAVRSSASVAVEKLTRPVLLLRGWHHFRSKISWSTGDTVPLPVFCNLTRLCLPRMDFPVAVKKQIQKVNPAKFRRCIAVSQKQVKSAVCFRVAARKFCDAAATGNKRPPQHLLTHRAITFFHLFRPSRTAWWHGRRIPFCLTGMEDCHGMASAIN